jgi:hypothetical protein
MAMNTIVCHAGAMSGRVDERDPRAAVVLGPTLGEVKGRHLAAWLIIKHAAEGKRSILNRLRSDRWCKISISLIDPCEGGV